MGTTPSFVDYETRGLVDLKLRGAYEYLPTSEILMVGFAEGSAEPEIRPRIKKDTPGPFISWGRFDLFIYQWHENPQQKSEDWINAMSLALYLGMPQGLNDFCTAVGFENKKDPRGTRLINKYCKPQEDGSFLELEGDDLSAFQEYCLQDVRLLQKAWTALEPFHEDWEQQWRANTELIERMNDRGVPIDRESAIIALKRSEEAQIEAREECKKLTGFAPSQTQKVKEFLGTDNVQRSTLEAITFDDPVKERVRQIRLNTGKIAGRKLVPMLAMSETDGNARGCLLSNGAHTGRGSSWKIQLQNMKRAVIDPEYFDNLKTWPDPIGGAQENIRGFIKAPPGRAFTVADYAQIECRILAHLAGEDKLLEAFRTPGRDVYREFAAPLFGVPQEECTGEKRNLGKLGVLGCGYGVSGPGLQAQAPNYGLQITTSRGWEVVNKFQRDFPAIVQFWEDVSRAAVACIRAGRARRRVGDVEFYSSGDFLTLVLPSGREVRYWKPEVVSDDTFSFMKRDNASGRMFRRKCWSGYLTENVCQAVATDVKLEAMRILDRIPEASLILEVHDELVAETREEDADWVLEAALDIMSRCKFLPPGLLKGEGAVVCRYTKI